MGGGNVAILFVSHQLAKDFVRTFTKKLLAEAPGLDVAIGHQDDVDIDTPGSLKAAWDELGEKVMPSRKEGYAKPQPILGLGVTAECAFTSLPAVEEMPDEDAPERGLLVSAEVRAKRGKNAVEYAKKRLNTLMPAEGDYAYPANFDDLGGEKGRARYIAVVHADGNGIGNRIRQHTGSDDHHEMIDAMRSFSEKINIVGQAAMQSVCDWLRITHQVDYKGRYYLPDRWLENEAVWFAGNHLPIRPIVFGGDDITFVCDGRLGLALAKKFLQEFSQTILSDGERGYACAGVAIVHSHYPFARAYALAEELARDAKRQAREMDAEARVSLLNWHYESAGLTLDWDDIRKRNYTSQKEGDLLLRPLVVERHPDVPIDAWRTWDAFTQQLKYFREDDYRPKLEDLKTTMRKGKPAVRKFTADHWKLPMMPGLKGEDAEMSGWYQGRCVYFDALEANDLLIYPAEDGK